jgi:hypothetical protein
MWHKSFINPAAGNYTINAVADLASTASGYVGPELGISIKGGSFTATAIRGQKERRQRAIPNGIDESRCLYDPIACQ